MKIKPYIIIENVIDKEYCKKIADYTLKNQEKDPREFYATYGLFNNRQFYEDLPYYDTRFGKFDPDKKILETAAMAKDVFLNNYKIDGDFELNRSHVNFMFKNAELASHKDDRNWDEPIETLPSRTYVCGLFLTDDYEGGELVFEEEKVSLHPSAGTVVLFPGYLTRHGVNKVISGTRINILIHFFDIIDRENLRYPHY